MTAYSDIDLHTHSNKSDGSLTPADLVIRAASSGIKTLALTDHDTISGLKSANAVAIKNNVTLINGVELSTKWNNKTIHILGLNIDVNNKLLIKNCERLKKLRKKRAKKIDQKLAKIGINGAYDYTKKIATNKNITRYHFAQFLIEKKLAKNQADVFKRFLVKNKPGYVTANWPNLEEIVNLIDIAGGVAVIAHPLRYKITATKLRELIAEFKDYGGKGIEVITSCNIADEIKLISSYAKKYSIAASIGSDFHSHKALPNRLGKLPLLPYELNPIWEIWKNKHA